MSSRTWLAVVAAGWLIAGPGAGQAQEQAQGAQRDVGQQQEPAGYPPLPFPVEIVEDETTAQARESREAEAERREIADLVAQEGMNAATQAMNSATQRMAEYAFWSTTLVGAGTVLLIITLGLTYQANRAAVAAVAVTRDIGERQLRAYVGIANISANFDEFGRRECLIEIRNYGITPARHAVVWNRVNLIDKGELIDWSAPLDVPAYSFTVWPSSAI